MSYGFIFCIVWTGLVLLMFGTWIASHEKRTHAEEVKGLWSYIMVLVIPILPAALDYVYYN